MENNRNFIGRIKSVVVTILTKINFKKVGIGMLVCAVITGAGSIYWHQQKAAERQKIIQARSTMIEMQAAQNNIILLDGERIKGIVAAAIGGNNPKFDYLQMELMSSNDKRYEDHDERKHENKHFKNQITEFASRDAAGYNSVDWNPIYKVTFISDNMKYRVSVDAVTGKILQSKVTGYNHLWNLKSLVG